MSNADIWYIVKQETGKCDITPAEQLATPSSDVAPQEKWGPYPSRNEALARRIGLIRAGKCKPS